GVYAIKRYHNETYAAGGFVFAGGTQVNYIARWNEATHAWSALTSGTNGPVYALEVFNDVLWIGGHFTPAGGFATGGLAAWDGTQWYGAPHGTFPGSVYSLGVFQGGLYIGGLFTLPEGYANLTFTYGINYGYFNNPNDAVLAVMPDGGNIY